MNNPQESILRIHELIHWLQTNAESKDTNSISIQLDKLVIYSSDLSDAMVEAHGQMDHAEEAYESAVAKYIAESSLAAAKSEREAEVKYAHLRKAYLEMQQLHRKFKAKLDRIDKICDHHKQRVSVIKQVDLKNL